MTCTHKLHEWDRFGVQKQWFPHPLRCLVVGENPGLLDAPYFYDTTKRVPVRTILLRELSQRGIIAADTLQAFHEAGFLFDHGIRCHLTRPEIKTQARLARRYESPLAATAVHLKPLLSSARRVWVMGYVARNAVAAMDSAFPRDANNIAAPPYPRQVPSAPRFFVSRYLTRSPHEQVIAIFEAFAPFWATALQ